MELYELMVNTYTSLGPAQATINRSAPLDKRKKNLHCNDPWSDQLADVTANKYVMIIKSNILKNYRLSIDYIKRDTALFLDVIYIIFTTKFEKVRSGNTWCP